MAAIEARFHGKGAYSLQHPPTPPNIVLLFLCVAYRCTPQAETQATRWSIVYRAERRRAWNQETPVWNRFAIDTDLPLMFHHGMGSHQFTVHECGGAETLIVVDRVFSNNSDIRSAAVDIAREMMAKEIGHGRLCLTCWIVVANEYGHNVMTLHFGDAIKMVDHDSCSASKASEPPASH